jgi:hypothetical protein
MRSKSKQRDEKKRRYGSARERADKKSVSERGPYLKIPPGTKMFQPKEGTMLIDILPYKTGKGNPCIEDGKPGFVYFERTYYVHRGIGANNEMWLCPRKTSKKRCPVCEARERLVRKGKDSDEDLIRDLAPKERQLFNVRDLKAPDKGIQLWDISFHLFGKALDARIRSADEEDEEAWNLFYTGEGNKYLKVTFEEDTYGGRSFPKTSTIDFRDRKEAIDEDEILEETHCLDELLVESDYDKMKKAFLQTTEEDDEEEDEDEEEGDEDEEEDEDEDDKPKSKKKAKSKKEEEDEDEDEEEDEDEDEEEDDDDEDEDEDEDEEEEDEKPSKKSKLKSKKSKSKEDDDEEEEDEDEDEDEEEEDEDEDDDEEEEDDEPPKKKSKTTTKSKKSKDEDEDEEEEEDDEDEDEDEDEEEDDDEEEEDEDEEDDEDLDGFDKKKSKKKAKSSSKKK